MSAFPRLSPLIHALLEQMALKAEKRDFVGCTQFWGYEYGYFFKNGPEGLGYYKDPHPRDLEAPVELPEAVSPADATEESKEAETTSRFSKKKKKKKPKAGDAEDDEKKKDKKKKKKKKTKDGDAAAEGDDSASKDKKKKKKKKKAAAEGDADVAEGAAAVAEE